MLHLTFHTTIIEWRGPSPFYFAPVPQEHADDIRHAATLVSYGWGVIPVTVALGAARFTTSLFPRDGTYLVPLKNAVRQKTGVTVGDEIEIDLMIAPPDF